MNYITSSQNPVIKELKSLNKRKSRGAENLFFVEGLRIVEEALEEGADIVRVLVSQEFTGTAAGKALLKNIRSKSIKLFILANSLYREMSDTKNPQGVMAVIKSKPLSLEEIMVKNKFLVILDSIQDPGNMGTIIRTADAADAGGVIVSKGCVDIYNPKVLRSTMGSIFRVPVFLSADLEDTIKIVKSKGIRVCAAHLNGDISHFQLDRSPKTAFIIGNEANGISDEVAALADILVKIPMPGGAESLNASVAAALLMYEAVRWRLA
ncbi:MAG: RNA methyltransferase [Clostridiales bacterium]|jgi:TrmH family RNA methyltransferase|nr:RNA methyltransferase [Eubacteriales bacterium]MDH7565828.1 RNA methyltransferase [Clostridiales bacterium]